MAKNLKLNIKNTQLAEALHIQAPKKKISEDGPPKKKVRIKEAILEEEVQKPRARILPTAEEVLSIEEAKPPVESMEKAPPSKEGEKKEEIKEEPKSPPKKGLEAYLEEDASRKGGGFRDFKDFKPPRRKETTRFDARDRLGLRDQREEEAWRKKRRFARKQTNIEELVLRPKALTVRLPISIKDLAQDMKLKASQLIAKLFMKGLTLTLNDFLEDETTVQLLGHDFDCEIAIDTSQEERLKITDKTIAEEIVQTPKEKLMPRAPVVTFMGHVDHGKTSLIDAIRKSNITSEEAGAITQHIGAFKTKTNSGEITILDTPGHEAFSEMRGRGANVTDVVVLVIAGDEGMKEQTIEAMNQAKEAKVPIIVALNKSDKTSFDPQKIYRELADHDLLPESWGGTTITVNCSATTGKGIPELLEMIALQSEVLELRANPRTRARGAILESQMHKGMGAVATVLIQNGTLKKGDAIVLGFHWGSVKTMQDEHGNHLEIAGPSTPVKITGLSDLVEAGSEFIVVKSEKEAKELAQGRLEGQEQKLLQQKKPGLDKILQQQKEFGEKKVLPLILKADVQGSLEALLTSLLKLPSDKVRLEIVQTSIGEVSESDIELAAASKATIIGFHTKIEAHSDSLIKLKEVTVRLHNIIYHAVDDVRDIMTELLDRIPQETNTGTAVVKATFKSSQLGIIAGCQVTEGTVSRSNLIRVIRSKEVIWQGKIASLKRVKEDVKEVTKGLECGILLENFTNLKEGDILQAYEITYLKQEL